MIMASALLFGEITAVVFTANKTPGGAQRSDSISLDFSRLLRGDLPAFSQVSLLLSSACKYLSTRRVRISSHLGKPFLVGKEKNIRWSLAKLWDDG